MAGLKCLTGILTGADLNDRSDFADLAHNTLIALLTRVVTGMGQIAKNYNLFI